MEKIKFKSLFLIYVFVCMDWGWYNQIFYYVVTVVCHEYGHAFVAKKLGYQSQGIIFNLSGAGLKTESIYKAKDDILISLAGPMVNFLFIILVSCGWWFFPSSYLFTHEFLFPLGGFGPIN